MDILKLNAHIVEWDLEWILTINADTGLRITYQQASLRYVHNYLDYYGDWRGNSKEGARPFKIRALQ